MFKEKQDVNYLVYKLLEFYNLLENYIWNHGSKNYLIVINCMEGNFKIKFMEDNLELDAFELRFSDYERDVYEYITMFYMFKLFQKVYVFTENNKIYNKTHKPYLEFIVDDEVLLSKCKRIVRMINEYQDEEIYQMLESIYFDIKKKNRSIDNDTKMCLDHRLVLTKKLLQSGVYG